MTGNYELSFCCRSVRYGHKKKLLATNFDNQAAEHSLNIYAAFQKTLQFADKLSSILFSPSTLAARVICKRNDAYIRQINANDFAGIISCLLYCVALDNHS